MICSDPRLMGRRRIVGMQSQPDSRLFRHRHHRFQEVSDVFPHFFQVVGALVRKWRQIFNPVVIKCRQARARPAGFRVVSLHQAVGIKVVFHHRHSRCARRPDGLLNLLNFLVAARPAVESVGEPRDHQVAQGQAP